MRNLYSDLQEQCRLFQKPYPEKLSQFFGYQETLLRLKHKGNRPCTSLIAIDRWRNSFVLDLLHI